MTVRNPPYRCCCRQIPRIFRLIWRRRMSSRSILWQPSQHFYRRPDIGQEVFPAMLLSVKFATFLIFDDSAKVSAFPLTSQTSSATVPDRARLPTDPPGPTTELPALAPIRSADDSVKVSAFQLTYQTSSAAVLDRGYPRIPQADNRVA